MSLQPFKKQKIRQEVEENEESLFLNLFDFHIIQQIFIQLSNSYPFYKSIDDCYSDCTSFSSTSKLFNSISKQTQFSIKIFQNQKIKNINFNIYLKLIFILQQEPILKKTFNSKEEILNHILIYISKKGIYNLIETLISNGADPDYENCDGDTPLFCSCEFGNYKTTKLLILNNSNINFNDQENETLLHLGCTSDNLKLVKYLVKLGLEINSLTEYENTPLHYACDSGSLDIVKYLVDEKQADIYDENLFRETILFHACKSANLDLVKYLIVKKKLNIHHKDSLKRTILFSAVSSKNKKLVDYLISLGLDINYVDVTGTTPSQFIKGQ